MSSEPDLGSPAPDFTLPAHTGRDVRLADLRGRKAVLLFYVFDFSPG
jgi:peroxiredoxin Q/BCP